MTTPRLLSERYELGEVLGYGGMSEVHRGLDTRLSRDVAIKVLRADLARDPQFQMRFRREAQNAAALNHPAIVAVYDTGEVMSESGPLPYIVMEYVDGQTLREIVKSTGPMTQQKVIEVMADVCAALDFSHRHQIIHRDVKPANIMINRAGAVKVMDFGIARALGEGQNVTQTAAVIGTAQYLSPEQARGEPVDARSDVYAAGCVLYELLTGEPPFTGDTPVAVAYQHVREEPKSPSQVNPSIPPSLDSVVLKALSKNPANRYQSAAEMRTDLVRVRSGQSPLAPVVMSEDERTAMMAPPTGPTRRINGSRHGAAAPAAAGYNDYYDEEPPRRTGRLIGIIAAALVVLGLLGFLIYQVFLSGPATPTQVAIPTVTGQTAQAANNAILAAQLRPNQVMVDSTVAQVGQVISTDPPAGTKVDERSTVTLSIGKGPAQVTVPKVSGQSVADATKLLTDAGLKVGTQSDEETTDSTLIGKVTRSDPDAGVSVAGASPVNIFVGKAPTNIKVPDVTGQDAATAAQTLTSAGFQVQTANVDGGGQPGSVLGTSPAAGSSAAKGSTVTLQLSNGNQASQVPDVRGQSASDAKKALKAAGYSNVNTTDQQIGSNNAQYDGKVIDQSVPAGTTADPTTQITLTIGKVSGNGGGGGIFGGN